MKTTSVLRQKTSLQDSVLDILNKQMAVEAHSSATYLSMSAWCYSQGLRGCGEFFRMQASEERDHMMKIFNYIADSGALAISPEIAKVERGFEDLRSILVMALEQEIMITENFNKMTEHCQKVRDYQTARFLPVVPRRTIRRRATGTPLHRDLRPHERERCVVRHRQRDPRSQERLIGLQSFNIRNAVHWKMHRVFCLLTTLGSVVLIVPT
ncbi:MAG: ferritin [Chryseolinea sp.]